MRKSEFLAAGLAVAVLFATAGCKKNTAASPAPAGEKKVVYWYDPMKPEAHFDKPGKSPFMDMQLEPKYA